MNKLTVSGAFCAFAGMYFVKNTGVNTQIFIMASCLGIVMISEFVDYLNRRRSGS